MMDIYNINKKLAQEKMKSDKPIKWIAIYNNGKLEVRAGMYKFCYRSEWVIIMSVKKGEWQAVDCNGGFANAYSKWACIDLAKNEIKKHPNWENNTYGWWKKDRMFDGLIHE